MKLVEILARNINWVPVGPDKTSSFMALSQRENGDIYNSKSIAPFLGEKAKALKNFELADDWRYAEVTFDQWEAERARIEVMEVVRASSHQANAVDESDNQAQHEQELWEKVVIAWIGGAASDPTTRNWKNNAKEFIGTAACVADAFMAERDKRMQQGV